MATDDLRAFIADLRARLECGDFHGQRDLSLGNEITLVDVELAVRDLLTEVDEYTVLPPEHGSSIPGGDGARS